MESVSRCCDHCAEELPAGMRSDARFCNSTCRSGHASERKAQPAGVKWIKGHWRGVSKPRRRRPRIWETVSPVLAVLAAQKRAEALR